MLINSCAKINLYLEVTGQRPDGYHEIETLFSTISLHDSLKFVLTKKHEIKILSNIPELASINNLVYQIAKRILSEFKMNSGIDIHLNKRIPISAGLGGGSSNAAMTILALNSLLELKLSDEYIQKLAADFGSDINFFLSGGFARGESRGEIITPLNDFEPLELLLVNPGLEIASSEAYRIIDWKVKNPSSRSIWFNRLETGIRKKYRVVDDIISSLIELGASEAIMSGSGSTCIGLFSDKKRQAMAVKHFSYMKYWTKIVETLQRSQYQQCFPSLS